VLSELALFRLFTLVSSRRTAFSNTSKLVYLLAFFNSLPKTPLFPHCVVEGDLATGPDKDVRSMWVTALAFHRAPLVPEFCSRVFMDRDSLARSFNIPFASLPFA